MHEFLDGVPDFFSVPVLSTPEQKNIVDVAPHANMAWNAL